MGKTFEHNVALSGFGSLYSKRISCAGWGPRKTMIGDMTGRPVEQRITGSAVAGAVAASYGAAILRVHDVAETRDAMAVMQTLTQGMQ